MVYLSRFRFHGEIVVSIFLFVCCHAPETSSITQKLYYQNDKRVPMTYINLIIRDIRQKDKLKDLVSTLLFDYPNKVVEEILQRGFVSGVRWEALTSSDAFEIRISTPSKHLHQVLSDTHKILYETDFSIIDIELAKAQLYHKQKKDIQENFFNAVVWYGLKKSTDFLGLMPLSELEGITGRDVQHCYEQMLVSPFYFSVISDLPRGEVESALAVFAKNTQREEMGRNTGESTWELSGRRVLIVNTPDVHIDECYWILKGLNRRDSDYLVLRVIVDAIGGDFDSLLYEILREEKGLCYAASAAIENWLMPGYISFYANPRTENTAKLVHELFLLIDDFSKEKHFWQKIEDSKIKLKYQYVYTQMLEEKLNRQIQRDLYGVPLLEQEDFEKKIDEIDEERVREVLAKVFSTQDIFMIFIGNADRLSKIANQVIGEKKVEILNREFFDW